MRTILMAVIGGSFLGLAFGSLFLLSQPNILFAFTLIFIFLILALVFFHQVLLARRKDHQHVKEELAIKLRLYEEETRFQTIFHDTNMGIGLLRLDGHFIHVNQALCHLFGYEESQMLATNFYSLVHSGDADTLPTNIQQLIDKKIKSFQIEQQGYRKNGEIIWILYVFSLIRNKEDIPNYFIIQVQDISLQKKAEDRLRHMAYHDALTGLANRNKLEQFISQTLASARRHQTSFALLFLDLDRFKNINDTIGHDAGDLLLQIIAERLRNAVRSVDMVARLGGDEFVLLVNDVKKSENVAAIAQKILENVLKILVLKGKEIYITTSIGISLFPYDGQNMQTLMKNADLALYRAKEKGRNNYQFYTVEMTAKAQEKMALQTALGHALVKNEFLLNYQPKMEVKTRRITGIEALLRWKNNEYEAIRPEEIIAIAEETGLIIPVSDWILRTACKQLGRWHNMGFTSLTMAVNCSPRQLKQSAFADDLIEILNKENLSPASLELEITESIIMHDPENTLGILYALKDIGAQIVIDDFGIGYWSLNNLRRLSVDKIKIDKSFIKQLSVDETSRAIISATLAMVNRLGIISIAEGVETREQYEFLANEGCAEIQGYYLTQPLSDEKITKFLKHPIPDAEVITESEFSHE